MLKLIVQEPKYQINIGYVARVAKNFGLKQICFVKPRTKLLGVTAIKFAKHARGLLEHAKVYSSLQEAVKGCDMIIGTTGVWEKAKSHGKNVMTIDRLAKELSKRRHRCVALILGRDDIGMSKEELASCDAVAYIPADPKYPVLNISHALAIMLYELSKASLANIYQISKDLPTRKELDLLFSEFEKMVCGKENIRNKKEVSRVFRNLVLNARLSKKEVHALITALK
ncbi:MAG: RNA methyltransferase [Candidatus Micrarchaeia archaeon]